MESEATIYDELHKRIARWLSERGIEKFEMEHKGDVVKVIVNGEEVAEVKMRIVENRVIYKTEGKWVDEDAERILELINKVKKGEAKPYQIRALLVTDGGYKAKKKEIYAGTTSVIQAILYKQFGMEIYYGGQSDLTKNGLKPILMAHLGGEEGAKVVDMIKADLENGIKALEDRKRRMDLLLKALTFLNQVEISIIHANKETGKNWNDITKIKKILEKRIKMFLTKLRLGKGGEVCLVDCNDGKLTLTYEYESYARIIAPLLYYIGKDASPDEVMKFLAYIVLFDGYTSGQVSLVAGNFSAKKKQLPLDIYDKLVLYMLVLAKYNIAVKRLYIGKNRFEISFDPEYVIRMFMVTWNEVSELLGWAEKYAKSRDHVFRKLKHIKLRIAKPNIIEIAGVKINIWLGTVKKGKSQKLLIRYHPKSMESLDRVVKVLKDAGFEEGLHFTIKIPKNGKPGYVHLRIPTGLWRLVELSKAGVNWAERTLKQLRDIAKERGFELLEEYLKPAMEAETIDPKGMSIEYPEKRIKATVKDIKMEWRRGVWPKIIVIYEIDGKEKSFNIIWRIMKNRGIYKQIYANVWLNEERGVVLAALTGDESLKKKKGTAMLTAKHLLALVRFKGIGWNLLKWYITQK